MNAPQLIQTLSVSILPILVAVSFHEAAHGWMADKKGDPTARMLGRITLNPLAHIHLVGTIIVPALFIITAGFPFGWAKPVPVNFLKLRNPKTDMAWVAAAGPGMNFILAFASGIALRFLEMLYPLGAMSPLTPMFFVPLYQMLTYSVRINTALMVFNLIPIPPLDGGRVLVGILPDKQSSALSSVEPFGMMLIMILVFADPLGIMRQWIVPIMGFFNNFFFGVGVV